LKEQIEKEDASPVKEEESQAELMQKAIEKVSARQLSFLNLSNPVIFRVY